jgi:hypothetical protein
MELELVAVVLAQLPPLGKLRNVEALFDVVVPDGVPTQNANDPEATAVVSPRRQCPFLRGHTDKIKNAPLLYCGSHQRLSYQKLKLFTRYGPPLTHCCGLTPELSRAEGVGLND